MAWRWCSPACATSAIDAHGVHDLFKDLIDWYLAMLDSGGYPLIVLLMAIESSFVPLPSELVIPPAAILIAEGRFSFIGIVLAGTLGSWLGATVMYWGSRLIGRPLVLRFGHYLWLPPEKIEAAEHWAAHYGPAGVFISRLLPVIRHLVGIPFGIVRMNFLKYSLYTLLGSGIWCAVLTYVGIVAGNDAELMAGSLHRITLWFAGMVTVLGLLYYFFVHRFMRRTPE
jgi:membrane protein DedA with SNARE-associated domain